MPGRPGTTGAGLGEASHERRGRAGTRSCGRRAEVEREDGRRRLTGAERGWQRARGGPARQIDEVDDDGRGWGRRPTVTSRGTPAQPSACIRCRRGRRCSSTSSRAPGRLVATSTVTARRWRSDDRGGKRASEEEGNGWGRQGDWRGDRGVEAWQPYPLAGFIAGEGGPAATSLL